jgi:exodeoxyribonuclease VII small subunit
MTKKTLPNSKVTFEERFSRLEEIVMLLDQGNTPLEELLALYEEGISLSKECSGILQIAEQRILILKNGVLAEES